MTGLMISLLLHYCNTDPPECYEDGPDFGPDPGTQEYEDWVGRDTIDCDIVK